MAKPATRMSPQAERPPLKWRDNEATGGPHVKTKHGSDGPPPFFRSANAPRAFPGWARGAIRIAGVMLHAL